MKLDAPKIDDRARLSYWLPSFACLVLAVFICRPAIALPGAGAPMAPGEAYPDATQSWVIVPAFDGRDFVLAQLPPRTTDGGIARSSPDGIYRPAVRLTDSPDALAAWGDSVYAVFSPKSDVGGDPKAPVRNVFTLKTQRFADSELWTDEPSGRMETLPGLPGKGRLLGFTAGDFGLCALITEEGSGLPRMVVLADREWRPAELPPELAEVRARPSARLSLAGDAGGLYLVATSPDAWVVWTGHPELDRSGTEPRVVCAWNRSVLRPAGLNGLSTAGPILRVAGRWYSIDAREQGVLAITEVDADAVRPIVKLEGVGTQRAIAPIDGLGRLAVLSSIPAPGPKAEPGRTSVGAATAAGGVGVRTTLVEVSLLTGRVLYDGPAKTLNPLGSNEFRLIAVGLILAMAFILVLVIRTDEPVAVHLPEGFSFADPLRRGIASVLDIAIVSLLVPRLSGGNSVLELLGPAAWLGGEAYETLLLVAGLGLVLGTVGEWLFGRTPGKLLCDCEVVSVVKGTFEDSALVRHPPLLACFVRNAIKWLLSPVAVLGLLDASGRHRGDQFARAAVVVEGSEADALDEPPGDE